MELIVVFLVWIGIAWLSSNMAETRERSPGAWAIAGLIFGIFAPILLLIIGDHPSKRYGR